VEWQRGSAKVVVESKFSGRKTFSAPRLLITVPLGVLQQPPVREGAIEFAPIIAQKQSALEKLAMGEVVRITFRFREPFWGSASNIPNARGRDLSQMSFVFSQQKPFPTWWTTLPIRSAILVGWAAGPNAQTLRGRSEEFILQQAIASLSAILGTDIQSLREWLDSWHFHDWQSDPFSRGAYSYVMVGGMDAQKELAAPVVDTLFFAGEATESQGHHATVHGAISSGYRAAREILERLA
jgi:monoamine oxidase